MGDICGTCTGAESAETGGTAEGPLGAQIDRPTKGRQVCGTNGMERYGTERLCPTDHSSLDNVMEYMKGMQHQMVRKVKQFYLRAG